MSSLVEAREWDSGFFGFPIGRVDLDGASPEQLAEIDREARGADIICLYGVLDPDPPQATYLVQAAGWRLVEVAVTFSVRRDTPLTRPLTDVAIRPGTVEDLPRLAPTIARAARWSRFAVDPRFGEEAARRMHEAWIRRAAEDEHGDFALFVAEYGDELAGFVSYAESPRPCIDFIATALPGTGIATALLQHVLDWTGADTIWSGPIAARNIACQRLVTHAGHRVTEVRYQYHRWLDEDRGSDPQGSR